MEFILFLSKIDKQIVELVYKGNYSIKENTAICQIDKKYVGFYKTNEREIVICTQNAKKLGKFNKNNYANNNHKTKLYIRRALRHEVTHLTQSCNNNKPTGIIKNTKDKINKAKLKALESSMKISKNYLKEIEAYVMEDKPRKVKKTFEKYCL